MTVCNKSELLLVQLDFTYIKTAARTHLNKRVAVILKLVFKMTIKKYEGLELLFSIQHRYYIKYYLFQVQEQLRIHHEQVPYLLQGIL